MNSLTRIMSYDKTKIKNQENCNCVECTTVEVENQIVEYPPLSDEEIEQIINERYLDKDKKTKKFIRRSLKVFGDRFDYDVSFYIKAKLNIKINCRKHGEFEQRVDHHYDDHIGCEECYKESVSDRMKILMNIDEYKSKVYKDGYITEIKFKEIIKEKFGNYYDLSKIKYTNANTKVTLVCPKHGDFPIKPTEVYNFKGCKKCIKEEKLEKNKIKFINTCNKLYDFYYDYSKVDYKGLNKKVWIICPKHGPFQQTPSNHLKHMCDKCGDEICAEKQRHTINEVLSNFRKLYGDLYDYSKFEYRGCNIESIIICKEHGEFKRDYNHHIRGEGCPRCKSSKGENLIRGYLLNNNIEFEEQKKFKDCAYKNQLRFDFYIPEINCCIEYNGKQHYESIELFGGDEALKYSQIRDNIKIEYCNKNNINLFIIRYDENLIEKLKECLNKYNYFDNF